MNNKNKLAVSMASAFAVMFGPVANAVELFVDPNWAVRFDNTVQYNLGFRAEGIDNKIGNNPLFSENDYKFDHAGDVVTNRLSLLTEFDGQYTQETWSGGFRLSGSLFRDFAYDSDVENNPGEAMPGVPYSSLGSYKGNRYDSYTNRYYVRGAQLLDAFVFSNLTLLEKPTTVRLGRFSTYWGNAMFSNQAGLAYSQNALDNIKGAAAPGTEAKELTLPRGQFMFSTKLNEEWSLDAQHFFEFEGNRIPEGGTYLGVIGPLFNGPDFFGGPGGIPKGKKFEPENINSNFGVKTTYQPAWLRGSLSAVYRHFDETQPWAPLFGVDDAGNSNYHLSYAEGVDLFGLSLEKQIGTFSTGFELSYRKNTALNSQAGPLPTDLRGREGARGDTVNFVANMVSGLTSNWLYDTGVASAEVSYTQLVKKTDNAELYNGDSNCRDKWAGCSTDKAVIASAFVEPQWLQVMPGMDLSMPMFAQYGVYGNTPSLGANVSQGQIVYTVGVKALFQNVYSVTLQYNGYNAHTKNQLVTSDGSGTGPAFYAGGNGGFFYNDKDWVSLTAKASF